MLVVIVIVILVIIAAIAIPMVMSNQTKANANEQSRSVLQDAVNRLNDGAIPEEDADTNDLTGNAKGGPYIKTIPNCDASGTETPLAINTTTGDVAIPEGCEKPTP